MTVNIHLLCKLREIWSTDFQESHSNCCHEMSHFKAENAPNSISAVALPQTPLGELTALPQTPWLDFKGLLLREGKGRKEERRGGEKGKGKEENRRGGRGKEGGESGPPRI